MKIVGFFDFKKALLEMKDKYEELLPEYNVIFEKNDYIFYKNSEKVLKLEVYPSFKYKKLEFYFNQVGNFENENIIKIIKTTGDFFESFGLLEVSLLHVSDFWNNKPLEEITEYQKEAEHKYAELKNCSYLIPNCDEAVKLIELLNSEYIMINPYRDGYTFIDREKILETFQFSLEVDYELYPEPCLIVYGGEKGDFELYYNEEYKGNVMAKLYEPVQIEEFYNEMKSISEKNISKSREIGNFMEKEIGISWFGMGINYYIDDLGPYYGYENISDIFAYCKREIDTNFEEACALFEKEKKLIIQINNFLKQMFDTFEKLDYKPLINYEEALNKFIDKSELSLKFNRYEKEMVIEFKVSINELFEDKLFDKETMNIGEITFSYLDTKGTDEVIKLKTNDLLDKVIQVVTKDRNEQRIVSVLKNINNKQQTINGY